jgi:hypothetical protein
MSGDSAKDAQARIVCECDGCSSNSHENGACHSEFKLDGRLWERRTWAGHVDQLLCPACWEDIAASQSPPPGLVT